MKLIGSPISRLTFLTGTSSAYFFAVYGGIINGNDLSGFAAGWGPPYYVVLWVARDSKRTGYWPAFHYGFWLLFAGIFLVPHYVFRTRGKAGFGLALGLVLLLCCPGFAAILGWWLYDILPDFR